MRTPKIYLILVILALVLLYLFPRTLELDATRSPDEKRWLANTNGFTTKLATGRIKELIQQPHPGITTQWLGSLAIRSTSFKAQKAPIVLGQGTLIIFIAYTYSLLWGIRPGMLLTILLISNPLLHAHTRVYAMDSLMSLFLILSIGLLLLWEKTGASRYLIYSSVTAAAAMLSKLPGIIIFPFSLLLMTFWMVKSTPKDYKSWFKYLIIWSTSALIGLIILLPTIAIVPLGVIGEFGEFFRSGDYQSIHQYNTTYYFRTLLFFSSPIHFLLLLLPLYWFVNHKLQKQRPSLFHLLVIALFGLLFFIQMTIGAKKGDRYILPTFLALDACTAIFIYWFYKLRPKTRFITIARSVILSLTVTILIWQTSLIWSLHPHTLAYINPISRNAFGNQRHGWGEGLDLAADYLNVKDNAQLLKVASYYPNEFSSYFKGETVPAHQHDSASPNYVVLYRAMLDRGADAWETDVIQQYANITPEKIISLSGIEFVWIYNTAQLDTTQK